MNLFVLDSIRNTENWKFLSFDFCRREEVTFFHPIYARNEPRSRMSIDPVERESSVNIDRVKSVHVKCVNVHVKNAFA